MIRRNITLIAAFAAGVAIPLLAATRPPDGSCFSPWQGWTLWRRHVSVHPVDAAEFALAGLRQQLPPGSRIGYAVNAPLREFMGNEREVQRFFASQYALTPAVTRLVHVPDCLSLAVTSRVLAGTSHVLLRGSGPETFSAYLRELSFTPVAASGGFVLFARSTP